MISVVIRILPSAELLFYLVHITSGKEQLYLEISSR